MQPQGIINYFLNTFINTLSYSRPIYFLFLIENDENGVDLNAIPHNNVERRLQIRRGNRGIQLLMRIQALHINT